MTKTKRPGVLRPLIVREGATYTCFGDGICCSDMHALGPVSREERKRLAMVHPGVTGWDGLAKAHVLATRLDGTCPFLREDQLCALHEPMGGMLKPKSCHRFPLGVTATPVGGRVTVEHRCSCLNVGIGAPVTPQSAEPQLTVGVRIRPSHGVGDRMRLSKRRQVSFARYVEEESKLLEALASRMPIEEALGREPFPELKEHTWAEVSELLDRGGGDSRFHLALSIYAGLLRERFLGAKPTAFERPWSIGFDRATERSEARPVRDVYAAWLADVVWSLFWTPHATFEQLRLDLATRYVLAKTLEARLKKRGLRADVAAGEAVLIVDLASSSERWHAVVLRMKE
ncbi:MAG: hypothetical protein MUE69_24195 [Myxococcota bacterium]|nr:hypothetical protein [Myxococcota bacterium]